MPSVSIRKPHHKQEHDASCLPARAKMLLNFLGNEEEEFVVPIDAFLAAWSEAKNIAITIERR